MTAEYELLEIPKIPAYLLERGVAVHLTEDDSLQIQEVSDGNLNRVFLARPDGGQSAGIALKQALPWVRVHGEGWPLTPERAVIEARTYEVYQRFSAGHIPELVDFNRERYIIAMEDLGGLRVWRDDLARGVYDSAPAATIGTFVARIGFHTSDFGMPAEERKLMAAEAVNPALCRITEDVVLSGPYVVHEHNHYLPALEPVVVGLLEDRDLRTQVGVLRHIFMTRGEALVHGDLHSGSIMIGEGRVVVIDPEFAFYGPLGFDLGVFWGNCIISSVRARVTNAGEAARANADRLVALSWRAFTEEWGRLWPTRVDTFFSDEFSEEYLKQVWSDALGFAGTEAMRRVIGYAHAADVTSLPEVEQLRAAQAIVRICRELIVNRHEITGPDDLADLITRELQAV